MEAPVQLMLKDSEPVQLNGSGVFIFERRCNNPVGCRCGVYDDSTTGPGGKAVSSRPASTRDLHALDVTANTHPNGGAGRDSLKSNTNGEAIGGALGDILYLLLPSLGRVQLYDLSSSNGAIGHELPNVCACANRDGQTLTVM